jgi:hypothetical protein
VSNAAENRPVTPFPAWPVVATKEWLCWPKRWRDTWFEVPRRLCPERCGRWSPYNEPPPASTGHRDQNGNAQSARQHVAVPALRIGIILVHERDSTQAALQRSHEIVIGQIAFKPHAFLALAVEQKHGRRFDGQEILVNEIGGFLIFVGLGIQPSTGASSRSRTEVQQNGSTLLFSCEERLIDVPAPVYGHNRPSGENNKV